MNTGCIWMTSLLGLPGGMPPTPQSLMYLSERARRYFGDGSIWQMLATGHFWFSLRAMALTMTGNVRVGMEDSLSAGKGVLAKSNADQVEKGVRIAKELDIDTATPAEARQILGLKGLDKVNY
jgi:uncharacterized protein (DUF849 family)